MKINMKIYTSGIARVAVVTLVLGAVTACASDEASTESPPADAGAGAPAPQVSTAPPASSTANSPFGRPSPRFIVPSAAGQSPPNVNTVPTAAPEPRSTAEERDDAREGLVADLANARHSNQGGRSLPVTVRPYVPPAASESESEPPVAAAAARLDEPAPIRPPEAEAPVSPVGPVRPSAIPTGN